MRFPKAVRCDAPHSYPLFEIANPIKARRPALVHVLIVPITTVR